MITCVNDIEKETILLGDINVNYMKRSDNRDIKNFVAEQGFVNRVWDFFKNVLVLVINKHAPIVTKRTKGRKCPWLSVEKKTVMNERDKVPRNARRLVELQTVKE